MTDAKRRRPKRPIVFSTEEYKKHLVRLRTPDKLPDPFYRGPVVPDPEIPFNPFNPDDEEEG